MIDREEAYSLGLIWSIFCLIVGIVVFLISAYSDNTVYFEQEPFTLEEIQVKDKMPSCDFDYNSRTIVCNQINYEIDVIKYKKVWI